MSLTSTITHTKCCEHMFTVPYNIMQKAKNLTQFKQQQQIGIFSSEEKIFSFSLCAVYTFLSVYLKKQEENWMKKREDDVVHS